MAIPSQIKNVGEYDAYIHMMLVAAPGFGKTVMAGTAPNNLFLTTDPEGTVSAKAFGSTSKEWQIKEYSDLNDAYRWLRDGGIKELGLEWVTIDNIAEAQNLGMSQSMKNSRANGNSKRDEFVPSIDDYQRSQMMLSALVKQFHDLPVNVLWTSWRKEETDTEGDSYFTCGIHGKQGLLAQQIQGYMNIVGFGEVVTNDDTGKDERVITFAQHKPYMGKDRYVALPPVMRSPNMVQITDLVNKAKVKHNADQAKLLGTAKKPAARRTAPASTTKAPARRRASK
jgi:hypothetical protein